jgi:hypothetical protein
MSPSSRRKEQGLSRVRVAQPLRHAQGSKLPIITNDRLPCFSAAAACFAESYDRCIVLIRADNNSYLCLEVPVSVANLYQAAAELSWTQQEVAIAATGSQQHIWHHGGCYCRCAGCLTRPARHSQADGHSRLQEALSLQGQRWHALVRPFGLAADQSAQLQQLFLPKTMQLLPPELPARLGPGSSASHLASTPTTHFTCRSKARV